MVDPTPPPDQFRLGETWLSPRGIHCTVIKIEPRGIGQAVMRQANGRIRRKCVFQPSRDRPWRPGWTRLEPATDG